MEWLGLIVFVLIFIVMPAVTMFRPVKVFTWNGIGSTEQDD